MNWYDSLEVAQAEPRVFVAGVAQCAKLASWNPRKITAVLNVNQYPDENLPSEIIYMHLPFDDCGAIPAVQFAKCIDWLKFMYENGHVILIHCAAGISRSVTIAASFLHYMEIMDFNEALAWIKKQRRSEMDPNPEVVNSAKRMLGIWPYNHSLVCNGEETRKFHFLLDQIRKDRTDPYFGQGTPDDPDPSWI